MCVRVCMPVLSVRRLSLLQRYPKEFPTSVFTYERFLWAHSTVRLRRPRTRLPIGPCDELCPCHSLIARP